MAKSSSMTHDPALHHPAGQVEVTRRAQGVLDPLTGQLPLDVFVAAWEPGRARQRKRCLKGDAWLPCRARVGREGVDQTLPTAKQRQRALCDMNPCPSSST